MHAYVREDERLRDCVRYEGKKRHLLFMLPGLCHVGCARMAGQKYLIKLFIFGVGEERHGGFCPALLSLRGVGGLFIFPALCMFLVPTILRLSSGYLSLNWSCDFDARPIQGQVTTVDLLITRRWTKQRFYCSTPIEVQSSILFAKFNFTFFITDIIVDHLH
ncbi:hypothetical protein RND71_027508 [Anisodus tanguticus]|uniref:Uncharacterized protein n=1 Tax=Anisodus tanguticus TaxID=243964 RepID=A0AAE1RI20_9SOLA|nr:hypothetical protein RND71_027508 [Anisodus tanguticus]